MNDYFRSFRWNSNPQSKLGQVRLGQARLGKVRRLSSEMSTLLTAQSRIIFAGGHCRSQVDILGRWEALQKNHFSRLSSKGVILYQLLVITTNIHTMSIHHREKVKKLQEIANHPVEFERVLLTYREADALMQIRAFKRRRISSERRRPRPPRRTMKQRTKPSNLLFYGKGKGLTVRLNVIQPVWSVTDMHQGTLGKFFEKSRDKAQPASENKGHKLYGKLGQSTQSRENKTVATSTMLINGFITQAA